MIESASPKLNRFKYAAMLLGALAVAATPLGYPAIANAEPGSGRGTSSNSMTACVGKVLRIRRTLAGTT